MVSIIVHSDPSGACLRDIYDVDEGTLLSTWMMEKWATIDIPTDVYLFDTTADDLLFTIPYDGDPDDVPDRLLSHGDIIHIVRNPQDPLTIIAAVSIVAGLASAFLLKPTIPSPEIPEFTQSRQSPNNQISGQTNIARPLQRIPDIYGKNRVYPDLIFPSYFEYVGNIQFVTEYLCIGRGEYLVEDLKSGNTLLTNIANSDAVVYEPNDSPTTILNVTGSNEVNGQELSAPNDGSTLFIEAEDVSVNAGLKQFSTLDSSLSGFSTFTKGDTFDVVGLPTQDGTYTFDRYEVQYPGVNPRYYVFVDEITALGEFTSLATFTAATGKVSEYGPFKVPGDPDEIWIDINAPRGLQEIDGTTKSAIEVEFDIKVQELDSGGSPVGGLQTFSRSISGNTQDEQNATLKVLSTDLNNPGQPHEVTVERTSDTTNDSSIQTFDLTKWTRLAGVESLTGFDPGNVTTVVINTQATQQSSSLQNRLFNAVATRKLLTYDTGTQTISASTAETTKFADAALFHLTDVNLGGKDVTNINLDELYEIQDRLDVDAIYGDKLGRFCYSFSDAQVPVKDELETILNAARVMSYQDGSTMRFVRDDIRDTRVALFNSRVKGRGAESKVINFFRPGDQDGVELSFTDEVTNEASTIILPTPSGGLNNKRITAAGIKNFDQAWNRATYEFAKLKLQRVNVSTKVTDEGILPRLNDRVANVDGTNVSAQGGEIIDFDTLTIQTDQFADFNGNATGTVILRADNGDVSEPLECEPRLDGLNGFILTESPLFGIYKKSGVIQVGMLYSFFSGTEVNHEANDYLIGKITPNDKGLVNLVLVNYRPEIYDADTTNPP